MAAYAEHAFNLGYADEQIFAFMHKALVATTRTTISVDELVELTLACGEYGVKVMALLDKANTESYGNPEITKVNIGVRNKPAILITASVPCLLLSCSCVARNLPPDLLQFFWIPKYLLSGWEKYQPLTLDAGYIALLSVRMMPAFFSASNNLNNIGFSV